MQDTMLYPLLAEKAGYCRIRRSNTIGNLHGLGDVSYCDLITQAILASPNRGLRLRHIYHWIEQNAESYTKTAPNWKNSVRHNLSFYHRFINTTCKVTKARCWTVDLKAGYSFREYRKSRKPVVYNKENKRKRKVGRSSSLSSVSSSSSSCTSSESGLSQDQTNNMESTAINYQNKPSLNHYIFSKDLNEQYGYRLTKQVSNMHYSLPQNMSNVNSTNQEFVKGPPEQKLNKNNKLQTNANVNLNISAKPNFNIECKSNNTPNGFPLINAQKILEKPTTVDRGLMIMSRPHLFSGGIIFHGEINSQNVNLKNKNRSSCLSNDQSHYLSRPCNNDIKLLPNSASFAPNKLWPAFDDSNKITFKNDIGTNSLVKRLTLSKNSLGGPCYDTVLPSTSSGLNTFNTISQINPNSQYYVNLQPNFNKAHVDFVNMKHDTNIKSFTIQDDSKRSYDKSKTSNDNQTCNSNISDESLQVRTDSQVLESVDLDFYDIIRTGLGNNSSLNVDFINGLTFR